MPIYEYKCKSCGNKVEVLQKMSDKPLEKCDKCGKKGLVKLMSQNSFHLKGKGWYKTDYGESKPKGKK